MIEYAPCPNCDSSDATRVTFTWWGGLIGPALFTHVRCEECGTQYNGKTGESNTTNIIVYTLAALGIGFIVIAGCAGLAVFGAIGR